MKQIKTFEAFDTYPGKIVFRALKREFDKDYDGIQYYAENPVYTRVFGNNIKQFHLKMEDVMDLDKWNAMLSKETLKRYGGTLFAVHSTYMDKESENYGYRYVRDTLYNEVSKEAFYEFQKEFNSAKIIKGKDSGNESQTVYAVRDKSLVTPI